MCVMAGSNYVQNGDRLADGVTLRQLWSGPNPWEILKHRHRDSQHTNGFHTSNNQKWTVEGSSRWERARGVPLT